MNMNGAQSWMYEFQRRRRRGGAAKAGPKAAPPSYKEQNILYPRDRHHDRLIGLLGLMLLLAIAVLLIALRTS